FVRGAGHPDAAVLFAAAARLRRVPGHADVAGGVGAHGAAAVEADRGLDHVPLRLERRARVAQPGVQHRRGVRGAFRLRGPHSRDVDPAALADGEVGATDVTGGDSAAGLAVDPERPGEVPVAGGVDVGDVAVAGL